MEHSRRYILTARRNNNIRASAPSIQTYKREREFRVV